MRELRGVQLSLAAIEAAGATVVVVSKDSPEELAALQQAERFGFTLLSDPQLLLARDLGVVHAGADFRHGGSDLARPAALFFAADGALRATLLTENWRERLDGEAVLAQLRSLGASR